jgi:hypothetical protein
LPNSNPNLKIQVVALATQAKKEVSPDSGVELKVALTIINKILGLLQFGNWSRKRT